MTTSNYTMTKTDLDYIFIICFPQDSVPAKTNFQLSQLECMNFFKTVKPDTLFIRKANTTVFIPFIETNIAALLFNNFSKTLDNDCVVFTESFIGINYRGKIRFCHHINSDNLQELLLSKYISNRVCYSVKHEEVQNISIPRVKPEQITSEFFEPEVSIENYWKHLYIKPKHKKLEWKSKSKKILEVIQNKDLLSEVQNYLKNDSFTHYRKRKHCPSVFKDELSEANQVKIDQEKDAVSISYATKDGEMQKNTKTRKSPILRKMTGNYSRQYRMSCTDLEDIIEIDVNKLLSNCDSENIQYTAGKKKTISIKDFKNKDVRLKLLELEVRKDFQDEHLRQDFGKNLQEITNLPLRWYPVRRQDIIVCPGGRKKKNDRQTERRPQQRSQAQNQSIHAQPTEDDPVPESLYTLSSDRFALPSQPDHRNLQHLVSSFTPRVEPISASTQQLRRLATRPRHQQYEEESARRESFNDWPSNTGQNPENMVTNGFFYTGRVDLIRCFMCGIGLKDWSSDDEPLFEHVRHSPDCPFLYTFLGQDVLDAYKAALLPGRAQPTHARDDSHGTQGASNITEGTPTAPGEGPPAPRNPAYVDLRQRIESFNNWPRTVTQTPRQLAEAGFFHTGESDTVRCFHCDGGLRRWDPRDDPWIEHTRWFPHCPYVRQVKGLEYVDLVQRAIRESATEDDDPVVGDTVGAMANLTVQPPQSMEPQEPAVTPQTILDMGYTREALTEAMKTAEERGMVNYTPQDLLEILLELGSTGQLTPPESRPQATQDRQSASSTETEDDPLFVAIENKGLRKVLKCSECNIRDKNILFLPCTHHCLCEECAEKATKCPVCDSEINRKIKTYMS